MFSENSTKYNQNSFRVIHNPSTGISRFSFGDFLYLFCIPIAFQIGDEDRHKVGDERKHGTSATFERAGCKATFQV